MKRNWMRSALVALLSWSAASAADGWSRLQAGMSRQEAVSLLGDELVATQSRGFEIVIYDGRAEAVFLHGHLVAWTAPAAQAAATTATSSSAAAAQPIAFQFNQTPRVRQVAPFIARPDVRSAYAILPAYRR